MVFFQVVLVVQYEDIMVGLFCRELLCLTSEDIGMVALMGPCLESPLGEDLSTLVVQGFAPGGPDILQDRGVAKDLQGPSSTPKRTHANSGGDRNTERENAQTERNENKETEKKGSRK